MLSTPPAMELALTLRQWTPLTTLVGNWAILPKCQSAGPSCSSEGFTELGTWRVQPSKDTEFDEPLKTYPLV